MEFDCIVRGGRVVDGSGQASRVADLAIQSGRVAAVGRLDGATAPEVIDAAGLVVMPGIVDHHTHYDPQLDFDPCATPSCFHGVTTVVSGHCGFSIAPCTPADRPFLTGFFAAVEGMTPSVLEEGLTWRWEHFPEYLDALEGQLGVNTATYIGHSSVRRHVMGEAASERAAQPDEIAAMERVVSEALDAGAAGLSTTTCLVDRDQFGRPVPSCFGDFDEVLALAARAGARGRGSVAILPDSAITGFDSVDTERLIALGDRTGLPILTQGLGHRLGMPELWQRDLETFEKLARGGAAVFSSYRTQPYRRPFTWQRGTSLYDGVFEWRDLSRLPREERLARLSDPRNRATLREALDHPNTDGRAGATLPPPPLDCLLVQHAPSAPEAEGRSIAELARETQQHPADVIADLAVDDALATEFIYSNETADWTSITGDSLQHPNLLVGVGDCGAHADRDDGAEWSTYFLSTWVRDRQLYSLEEGIRRVTHEPAARVGLRDRGLLAPGFWADIVLLDLDRLELGPKRIVRDLPGGGERWQVGVEGIERVLVNGRTLVRAGRLSGALPGQVLRVGSSR